MASAMVYSTDLTNKTKTSLLLPPVEKDPLNTFIEEIKLDNLLYKEKQFLGGSPSRSYD